MSRLRVDTLRLSELAVLLETLRPMRLGLDTVHSSYPESLLNCAAVPSCGQHPIEGLAGKIDILRSTSNLFLHISVTSGQHEVSVPHPALFLSLAHYCLDDESIS